MVKKSQARIVWAWLVRNCFQVGPYRRGAGSTPDGTVVHADPGFPATVGSRVSV